MNKHIRIQIIVLGILLVGLLLVKSLIFGGAPVVRLVPAPALSGQVAQSFAGNAHSSTLPVQGKDFKLANTLYFDNGSWAVSSIVALNNTMNDGWVVLQKRTGMYAVVLGPGTAFPSSYAQNLPPDVAQYLNQQGVLYGSVGQ